jgi:hypothetical protein
MLRYVVSAMVLILVVALSPLARACPTSLNLIPSVDIMEPWTLSIQYENDGYPQMFRTDSEDMYFVQMGITPRLEAGIDFCGAGAKTETYVNAKYQLLSETEKHPALSIGTMSIGAACSPVYYAVAARTFGKPRLHMGAMSGEGSSQLLAGFDLSVNDSLCLMTDYISGQEGFASVGVGFSPKKGPSYLLVYGFANDPAAQNLCFLNVAWEFKLK